MQTKSAFLTLLAVITAAMSLAQTKTAKPVCTPGDECCRKTGENKVTNKDDKPITPTTKSKVVACKLTSPELQKRKAKVISLLKANVLARKEMADGYQFSFKGSDQMLDHLTAFIKTERACCSFFTFTISIEDSDTNLVLIITGPAGTKEFIDSEMNL